WERGGGGYVLRWGGRSHVASDGNRPIPRSSSVRRAVAVGGVTHDRGRAALARGRGHGRSGGGRVIHAGGRRSRGSRAEAGRSARYGRSIPGRTTCPTAGPQARTRTPRSGKPGTTPTNREGQGSMSDPESFLSRWSRRKREVPRETEGADRPAPKVSALAEDDHTSGDAAHRPAPSRADLPFDPASLPPIQSITAETDIRGFLRAGVPSELTRAALRRAWAGDPAI